MEIKTKRLILRQFKESDYDDLYEFLSQLKDDEFEGYPGIDYENGRGHLKYRLNSQEFFAIVLPSENQGKGKVIGNIYCGKRDFYAGEVGYIINKNFQKKGYGAEALWAVVSSAFKEGAHRVYAECDPRNTPSWKLLEKVGLQREAHFKKNIFFHKDAEENPVWKDTYVYAIIKEDWESIPVKD